MLPLLPIAVAGLGGLAWWRSRHSLKGKMTADRMKLLQAALESKDIPAAGLESLAAAFEKEGLHTEAQLLLKRAALRAAPPEIKSARKEVFQKALASNDPVAVDQVANAFHGEGATGAAATLRRHSAGLRAMAGE